MSFPARGSPVSRAGHKGAAPRLVPLVELLDAGKIAKLVGRAHRNDPTRQAAKYSTWFEVVPPAHVNAEDMLEAVRELGDVESACLCVRPEFYLARRKRLVGGGSFQGVAHDSDAASAAAMQQRTKCREPSCSSTGAEAGSDVWQKIFVDVQSRNSFPLVVLSSLLDRIKLLRSFNGKMEDKILWIFHPSESVEYLSLTRGLLRVMTAKFTATGSVRSVR